MCLKGADGKAGSVDPIRLLLQESEQGLHCLSEKVGSINVFPPEWWKGGGVCGVGGITRGN